MKTITTNNHTIVILEVDNSAFDSRIVFRGSTPCIEYNIKSSPIDFWNPLTKGFKYSIAGTITKEGIFDFDCSELIEYNVSSINKEVACIIFLETHGIYLNNPMGLEEPENCVYNDNDTFELEKKIQEWINYESKTLKEGNKLLILIQDKV